MTKTRRLKDISKMVVTGVIDTRHVTAYVCSYHPRHYVGTTIPYQLVDIGARSIEEAERKLIEYLRKKNMAGWWEFEIMEPVRAGSVTTGEEATKR